MKAKQNWFCSQVSSAGVRAGGQHDVRTTLGERFRAGGGGLQALRGAGRSRGHVHENVVHERDPRLRFLGLRPGRAHDTQRGKARSAFCVSYPAR